MNEEQRQNTLAALALSRKAAPTGDERLACGVLQSILSDLWELPPESDRNMAAILDVLLAYDLPWFCKITVEAETIHGLLLADVRATLDEWTRGKEYGRYRPGGNRGRRVPPYGSDDHDASPRGGYRAGTRAPRGNPRGNPRGPQRGRRNGQAA